MTDMDRIKAYRAIQRPFTAALMETLEAIRETLGPEVAKGWWYNHALEYMTKQSEWVREYLLKSE